jgi:hypothetical protein
MTQAFNKGPKSFSVERRGHTGRVPFKPKAWSHQDDLREGRGKIIQLGITGREPIEGVLLEADQFTIKLQHVANPKKISVFFKSAVAGFWFVEKSGE